MGEIANAMTRKYNVGVICGPEVYDKRKKLDANNKFQLNANVEIHRAGGAGLDKNTTIGKALSFILMTKRMMALTKTLVKKGDKVLMVTNPAPMVVMMSRLKEKVGFELNILVHDVFPENTKPADLKLPLYCTLKRVFDRAYAKADQLIVLGRDMKVVMEQKIDRYSHKPVCTIIENWADVDGIKPQDFPKGRIVLQYAGNIGRVQGLDKVIAQLTDDVEFHLYGTGAMEESLKKMGHPNVFFHGPYYRSQQNEVLATCDISVVTLQDGMYGLGVPSKTYNILASGRPVLFLGPENSEIDLLVRERGIGYCHWPKKWDKEELAEMGARARKLAVEEYSKEMILNKFVNAI
ncbi:MAG: glycosyltransferase family 4 protein [Candidatus Egerieousia sp.]|nr:glycosyltransferase family 4 protein [Candidatus Egerieousia sp.]